MRYAWRGTKMSVMVSQSWDGELTSRTLDRLGIDTVRGSSSRGGAAALRDALRRAREGSDLTFTPDGPRGPLRVVQPGVVVAAAITGMPVVTTALAANRARTLRSWDRMLVPLPGSRVDIVYGEVMRFARDEPVEAACARLGAELNRIEARAEALAADTTGSSEGTSYGTPAGSSTSSEGTSYGTPAGSSSGTSVGSSTNSEGGSTGSSEGTSYGTSEGGST
jgi:lysophospholipid acyltransferase (LPLAT)-like uncharacterized protein